ncbi:MAG: hypothetical protein NZ824_12220 [Candidatus Thioglobus sp.]|nr:hypothetical protein [Candidatus Thioglobus sp.]
MTQRHLNEDCKVKLEGMWSLCQQIKVGAHEKKPHELVMLAEMIQQDISYLEREVKYER